MPDYTAGWPAGAQPWAQTLYPATTNSWPPDAGTYDTSQASRKLTGPGPVSFTAAGTLASGSATGLASLAHTNAAVGNVLVLGVKITTTTITVTGVSGGGATGWTRIACRTARPPGPRNCGWPRSPRPARRPSA